MIAHTKKPQDVDVDIYSDFRWIGCSISIGLEDFEVAFKVGFHHGIEQPPEILSLEREVFEGNNVELDPDNNPYDADRYALIMEVINAMGL